MELKIQSQATQAVRNRGKPGPNLRILLHNQNCGKQTGDPIHVCLLGKKDEHTAHAHKGAAVEILAGNLKRPGAAGRKRCPYFEGFRTAVFRSSLAIMR
jgi:hypothetical protein